jgi:hypothetical protein
MNDATLVINSERITLSDETDAHALIIDMMNAMVAGGAFVHVEGQNGATYDVLVTATTQVLFSHGSMTFASGPPGAPGASALESFDPDNPTPQWASKLDLDL